MHCAAAAINPRVVDVVWFMFVAAFGFWWSNRGSLELSVCSAVSDAGWSSALTVITSDIPETQL